MIVCEMAFIKGAVWVNGDAVCACVVRCLCGVEKYGGS